MLGTSRDARTNYPRNLSFKSWISNSRKGPSEVFAPLLREARAHVPAEECDLRARSLQTEGRAKLVFSEDWVLEADSPGFKSCVALSQFLRFPMLSWLHL